MTAVGPSLVVCVDRIDGTEKWVNYLGVLTSPKDVKELDRLVGVDTKASR